MSRAEEFAREPFVLPGEDPAEALAPGSARRRALDAALAEMEEGAEHPSTHWRREYSLMLGLERVLYDDEPKLADGTQLNPHQVDALSGTLTALLAEAQRGGNGNGHAAAAAAASGNGAPAPSALGSPAIPGEEEIDEEVPEDEEPLDWDAEKEADDEQLPEAPEDPNAHKRFWFEHATGAGKTVAAMGFVEASRTGGILILTHRRNLVDQFNGELRDRGYRHRVRSALLAGQDAADGPVTVETYQWFVRNAGSISSAYTVVICDEAHTALGEKTAAAIRNWTGPMFIGMTATGALIARHVTDLFPTQTSRFDLAQAARRGVIAPLRCVRIPPGPGVRTIAKVPLRRGEVDTEFDQELLAELLDQLPFNLAAANLYKTRFNGLPGVVYAAGVRHAYNLAEAFREEGIKAEGVSGETPKRQLAEILAKYERGEIDVLINAQLLAEGWNSPRATVCFHLAPTASKRIYQQRVGRVTRRHPGKEAGIVVDFVHPGTKHDDPVVTLHSLLDRDVYRGGAIVVGPVRRGRGRRVRVERRVLPVASDENRRIEVFERELWRIAVEHLDWGEQIQWAALAGARVAPSGWRRARAMLHFDRGGELKRAFLLTAVQRNKNPQLRLRAIQEIAAARDPEAFDSALDEVGGWPRDEKREAAKVMLQALAEKRIGRRDQADAWIWRVAAYTAELHEEYAVQRWPETKRLLGLLANSSGGGHARNARRLVHAARKQDRRLAAALLAAATRYTHTPEAEEILRGARTRMARKPSSLSRELLRNFPKGRRGRGRRRKKKGAEDAAGVTAGAAGAALAAADALDDDDDLDDDLADPSAPGDDDTDDDLSDPSAAPDDDTSEAPDDDDVDTLGGDDDLSDPSGATGDEVPPPSDAPDVGEEEAEQNDEAVGADHEADPSDPDAAAPPRPKRRRTRSRRRKPAAAPAVDSAATADSPDSARDADSGRDFAPADAPGTGDPDLSAERAELEGAAPAGASPAEVRGDAAAERVAAAASETASPKRRRTTRRKPPAEPTPEEAAAAVEAAASAVLAAHAGETADADKPKPKRRSPRRKPPADPAPEAPPLDDEQSAA
ncbi:MAG TPA: DEAD/DEAH box helicase family protein [Solirubrobacteraceae bacterium]